MYHVAITTSTKPVAKESDSEEEIDFGFWEKASPIPPGSADRQQQMKEVDLNLLWLEILRYFCLWV